MPKETVASLSTKFQEHVRLTNETIASLQEQVTALNARLDRAADVVTDLNKQVANRSSHQTSRRTTPQKQVNLDTPFARPATCAHASCEVEFNTKREAIEHGQSVHA